MDADLRFTLDKIEAGARHLGIYKGPSPIDVSEGMLLLGMFIGIASRVKELEGQLTEMREFANRLLESDGVQLVPDGGR